MADREHDVVVYGATGFTGALTAQYLAGARRRRDASGRSPGARSPSSTTRCARSRPTCPRSSPTRPTRSRCARWPSRPRSSSPRSAPTSSTASRWWPRARRPGPPTSTSRASRSSWTSCTSATTARRRKTGARIIHACGFDSIPQDLGAHFTVQQLPEGVPIAIEAFVRAGGNPSGGTVASALGIMGRYRQGQQVHKQRLNLEPATPGRKQSVVIGRPKRDGDTGFYLLPMPTIDPQIVRQSAPGAGALRPRLLLRAVHRASRRRRSGSAWRAGVPVAVRRRAARPGAQADLVADPAGDRPVARAAREGLVQGALPRHGRRPDRGDGGQRRRPGLRRDVEDARRVRALASPTTTCPTSPARSPPRRRWGTRCASGSSAPASPSTCCKTNFRIGDYPPIKNG